MKGIKVKFISTSEDGLSGLLTIGCENEEYVFGPKKESLAGLAERLPGYVTQYETKLKEDDAGSAAREEARNAKKTEEKPEALRPAAKSKVKPPEGAAAAKTKPPVKAEPEKQETQEGFLNL